MKKLILGLILALIPQLALAEYILKGPHTTVETDGSQADGSVNLITKNAGPINFYTDNVLRGGISSTGDASFLGGLQCTGTLSFPDNAIIAAGSGAGEYVQLSAPSSSGGIYFANGGSNQGVVDSSGLILGGTTHISGITNGPLEIQANGSATTTLKMVGYSATANDGPGIVIGRTKGAAAATNTIVASGDNLGDISFRGANGTSYTTAAAIRALVDGTPGASNDMPGSLAFYTTPDGSGTQLTRWTVQSDGDLSGDATNSGDISLEKSGSTLRVQEGTASTACMGVGTPNGNTNVAITTSCAVAGSRIFYTRLGAITNMGVITTTVAPNGSGFSFASTGASDTGAGTVYWLIIKEAP